MKTPAQLFCLFGLAIALTQPCRGVVAVTWLDDPIVLWTEWNSRYTPLDINGDELTDYVFAAAIGFVGVRSEGENQYLIWPSGGHNIGGDVEPLAEGFEIGPNSGDDSWMEWSGMEKVMMDSLHASVRVLRAVSRASMPIWELHLKSLMKSITAGSN